MLCAKLFLLSSRASISNSLLTFFFLWNVTRSFCRFFFFLITGKLTQPSGRVMEIKDSRNVNRYAMATYRLCVTFWLSYKKKEIKAKLSFGHFFTKSEYIYFGSCNESIYSTRFFAFFTKKKKNS